MTEIPVPNQPGQTEKLPPEQRFHERSGRADQPAYLSVKLPRFYRLGTDDKSVWDSFVLERYLAELPGQDPEEVRKYVETQITGPDSPPLSVKRFATMRHFERDILEQTVMGRNKVILLPHTSGSTQGFINFELTKITDSQGRVINKDRGVALLWDGEELSVADGPIRFFPNEDKTRDTSRINYIQLTKQGVSIKLEEYFGDHDITDLAHLIVLKSQEHQELLKQHNEQTGQNIPSIGLRYRDVLCGLEGLTMLPSVESHLPSEAIWGARADLLKVFNETATDFPTREIAHLALTESGIRLTEESATIIDTIDQSKKVMALRNDHKMTWNQMIRLFPPEVRKYISANVVKIADAYVPVVAKRIEVQDVSRQVQSRQAIRILENRQRQLLIEDHLNEQQANIDATLDEIGWEQQHALAAASAQTTYMQMEANTEVKLALEAGEQQVIQEVQQYTREQLPQYLSEMNERLREAVMYLMQQKGNKMALKVGRSIAKAMQLSDGNSISISASPEEQQYLNGLFGNELPQLPVYEDSDNTPVRYITSGKTN